MTDDRRLFSSAFRASRMPGRLQSGPSHLQFQSDSAIPSDPLRDLQHVLHRLIEESGQAGKSRSGGAQNSWVESSRQYQQQLVDQRTGSAFRPVGRSHQLQKSLTERRHHDYQQSNLQEQLWNPFLDGLGGAEDPRFGEHVVQLRDTRARNGDRRSDVYSDQSSGWRVKSAGANNDEEFARQLLRLKPAESRWNDRAGGVDQRGGGLGGEYDHWFASNQMSSGRAARAPAADRERHWRHKSDLGFEAGNQLPQLTSALAATASSSTSKQKRRVPQSASCPQSFTTPNREITREIEITDLSQRDDATGGDRQRRQRQASRTEGWWHTLAVGGRSNERQQAEVRTVSKKREATLRASAEQLDHVPRRSVTVKTTSHRRTVSDVDAPTRGSEISEDYEATPASSGWGGGDDEDYAWTSQAEAVMSLWYRPEISREKAVAALRNAAPGSFLIRNSLTFPGAYGLALRVAGAPLVQSRPGSRLNGRSASDILVRHFLIETASGGGVRLRGCANEPVFAGLADLVQRHAEEALALPCRLLLPSSAAAAGLTPSVLPAATARGANVATGTMTSAQLEAIRRGNTYKVLYFCTVDVPHGAGAGSSDASWSTHQAVSSAVGRVTAPESVSTARPVECRMRVGARGVKLAGLGWHTEFRLAYAAKDCRACELDPAGRRFAHSGMQRESRLFGLLVKKYSCYGDQNACLVLGDADRGANSAPAIAAFVNQCIR